MTRGIRRAKESELRIAIGIMAAPRRLSTVNKTIESLLLAGFDLHSMTVFCEPGDYHFGKFVPDVVQRPVTYASIGGGIKTSPDGRFGNFQNFVQTLRDLVWISRAHFFDAVMVVEDDAVFSKNILPLVDRQLKEVDCGLLSLYSPDIRGFFDTNEKGCHLVARKAFFGGLAMILPVQVAADITQDPSVIDWKGSKKQEGKPVRPWERNASDSWAGQMIRNRNLPIYAYNPSLVSHYCPESLYETGNSSLTVNGRPHLGTRQAKGFIGESVDAFSFFNRS